MSNRFRPFALAVLVLGAALVAPAALTAQGQKIRVYVFAQQDDSGFVDALGQELEDSVKDLQDAIRKRRGAGLEVVTSRKQADILLEVTDRGIVERTGEIETSVTVDKSGRRASSRTREVPEHDVIVRAVMHVGDYSTEFTGICNLGYLFGGPYREAAKDIASELEKWVKRNGSRLAKTRG